MDTGTTPINIRFGVGQAVDNAWTGWDKLDTDVLRNRPRETINNYGRYYRRKFERSIQAIRSVHI
jgi:hypothetical protein